MTASASDNAAPARVSFKTSSLEPGGDARAWGYLDTRHARVGVMLQRSPQPHLALYPPVRVPDGRLDAFLDTCLERARESRAEWGLLTVDPADGEVSLRMNLASGEGAEIERALARAAAFLDEEHVALAKACFDDDADTEPDDEAVGGHSGMKGLIERWLGPTE
ncbi:hypothetical protein [Arabiibacter massiliensis]|uniref:hypothetical protein n=1 Tax=Arabiibacter massiliensis TaxID=1870985 RepID=UPI0009BC1410|nr:hypothetical protein [Arabiibacter massiliensis]